MGFFSRQDPYGPLSGQVIQLSERRCNVRSSRQFRLVQAMSQGHSVRNSCCFEEFVCFIDQRGGRVTKEALQEPPQFVIDALNPIRESFGFARDLRKRTLAVSHLLQLVFSLEILPEDPFWEPTTEEEVEEFGTEDQSRKILHEVVDSVRRQGLAVEEKLYSSAEKQRTLKR